MCAPSLSQPLTQPLVPPGHPAHPLPTLTPFMLLFLCRCESLWEELGAGGSYIVLVKAVHAATINEHL